jgi:hypothetical protein
MALFSFALRWHKASHGTAALVTPQTTTARMSREALDAWRDEHRRTVLNARTCVYFTREPPRAALFENFASLAALVDALRAMTDHSAALFVIGQLCDAMRFIVRTEVLVRGELAIARFLDEFAKRLVEHIEAAEQRLLTRALETVDADTKGMNAVLAAQYRTTLRDDLDAARAEPARFQVRCAASIDASELSLEDRLLLTSGNVADDSEQGDTSSSSSLAASAAISLVDSSGGGGSSMSDLRRSMVMSATSNEAVLANSLIVSYNFFVGTRALESVLVDAIRSTRHTVMRNGTAYVRVGAALEASVALLRAYLSGHATAKRVAAAAGDAAVNEAETALVDSMPVSLNYYAEADERNHELDDVALEGAILAHMHTLAAVRQSGFLDAVARSGGGGGGVADTFAGLRIPPFNMFDEARYYSLQRDRASLHRLTRLPYTLYSPRNGSIRVRAEALERALHATPALADAGIAALGDGSVAVARERAAAAQRRLSRAIMRTETSESGGAALVDIEDLVEGARANRALPLCMLNVLERDEYPKHSDRLWLAQTLHSFDTPALNTATIARSLMRLSTPQKIGDHFKELSNYTRAQAALDHDRNATFVATRNGNTNVSDQQMKEALAKTTCTKACSTHYEFGDMTGLKRCPFSWEDKSRLDALLARSGVASADARAEIIALVGAPRQCALQLAHSRPAATRHVDVLRAETRDVVIAHPYHYFHLAADHLQRAHETPPAQIT